MNPIEVEVKLDEFSRFVKAQGWTGGDIQHLTSHLSRSFQILNIAGGKSAPTSGVTPQAPLLPEANALYASPQFQSELPQVVTPQEKQKKGRPKGTRTKRTKRALRTVMEMLRSGATYEEAARKADMTKETLMAWRHEDPQFGKACMMARRQGVENPIAVKEEEAETPKRMEPPRGSNAYLYFHYIKKCRDRVTLKQIVDVAPDLGVKYKGQFVTPQTLAEYREQIENCANSAVYCSAKSYGQILNYGDHSYQWVGK